MMDKYRFGFGKTWILLLLLMGYIFVLPSYFYPESHPVGNCGLPVMGIALAFWILGCGSALVIHFSYLGIRNP
jgi:ABC-type Co2+ transport system permease subunit